jgi:hypothetical protein
MMIVQDVAPFWSVAAGEGIKGDAAWWLAMLYELRRRSCVLLVGGKDCKL